MSYDKADLIKFILVVTAVLIVCLGGIRSCTQYNTEVNRIEQVCYDHGGHMVKAPYSDSYMTCVGQTR